MTLDSPIRSFHLRLCFGRENAGRNRIEVLVSKAMDAAGPPGGLVCTFGVHAAPGCVCTDFGLLPLEYSPCCLLSFNDFQFCLNQSRWSLLFKKPA